jgi:hypothetical protein
MLLEVPAGVACLKQDWQLLMWLMLYRKTTPSAKSNAESTYAYALHIQFSEMMTSWL